ncbi:MAG: Uma2 family endonuclease [Armatimonadetes bacterium]|nr:Uma2 family endonuclease [Anaerolineae bacterium]
MSLLAHPTQISIAPPISATTLMAMPQRFEILNEELVEMPGAGGLHHVIAGNVYRLLDAYVRLMQLGVVFFDGLLYLMYSNEKHLKHAFIPDVSFIKRENIPAEWQLEKPHPGVPDLAVEVISPGDDAEAVQAKVRVYLEKGTQEVWLVYPKTHTLHQYTSSALDRVQIYSGVQPIDTSALFPGLDALTPDALFTLPDWMTPAP